MVAGLSARKDAFAKQTQEVFVPLAERLGISTRTVKRHMVLAFGQCLSVLE